MEPTRNRQSFDFERSDMANQLKMAAVDSDIDTLWLGLVSAADCRGAGDRS